MAIKNQGLWPKGLNRYADLFSNTKMEKSDCDTIVVIILGALGAVALAKLLSQKKCSFCGHSNPNTNAFCESCGGRLT